MFKKVSRNIRRRRDSNEDGEADDDPAVPSPASVNSNTASAAQPSVIPTVSAAASSAGSRVKLSFEDGKVKSFVALDFSVLTLCFALAPFFNFASFGILFVWTFNGKFFV